MKKSTGKEDKSASRQHIIEEFGDRLKRLRVELKINQKEMADTLEVSPSYISEIESGKTGPGFEFMYKLGHAYNISPLYLLHGREPKLLDGLSMGDTSTENTLYSYAEFLKQDWVKEIIYHLERSELVRWVIQEKLKSYLFQNKELLKEEQEEHEAKKRKKQEKEKK